MHLHHIFYTFNIFNIYALINQIRKYTPYPLEGIRQNYFFVMIRYYSTPLLSVMPKGAETNLGKVRLPQMKIFMSPKLTKKINLSLMKKSLMQGVHMRYSC